ncbi:hypothetical protein P344_02020 [Spiroplasma mirum ATCC 29335]|uniref:Uncharacterized protein n=1 Tax=Spiroplasma mirum ATCC 29335 TaxID=838561 RepID=W0GKK6_9MOLU|nr:MULTISPECIES: hypothetical protein [Spiroplasma]AHF60790.1 putative transmembrane protein [Spiroplasma mirum ATCC 29335]AHI57752.1 hypothetical protein P344_02020 [Spiroplasma mirum ATCC 29335]AKM52903.1 hypothetical protein SATRI_v1c03840 [Spiroplasma atrichopogonis]
MSDNFKDNEQVLSPPIKHKTRQINKKTNLKIFAVICSVAIALGMVGMIYVFVAPSSYNETDPWQDAIPLGDKITNYINGLLSKDLAQPENLNTYVHFTLSEKPSIDNYANSKDTDLIRNVFQASDWISADLTKVEELLEETGAKLSGTNIIYKGSQMKLTLLPRVLSYPYNGGDDKYGLMYLDTSVANKGMFSYKMRFALELMASDGANNYIDLKKRVDYWYEIPHLITIAQLLNLANNSEIQKFIQDTNLDLNTTNEQLLSKLLKQYYCLNNDDHDQNIIVNQEITGINDKPFAPIKASGVSADDFSVNVLYDSRKINSFDQLGASLFNNHQAGYETIAKIFNTLNVQMPIFSNVGGNGGFTLYDKTPVKPNPQDNFVLPIGADKVNSYQGYIKDLGIESDNMQIWNSEHQIFHNQVQIAFLDTKRIPTDLYYNQQTYTNRALNLDSYQYLNDFQAVVDNIQYDDANADLDLHLTQLIPTVKNNLTRYLWNNLNDPNAPRDVNLKELTISTNGTGEIRGTTNSLNPPVNGQEQGNVNKVYQDRVFTLPKVNVKATFWLNDAKTQTKDIKTAFTLPSKVVQDPRGVDKNDLNTQWIMDKVKDKISHEHFSTLTSQYSFENKIKSTFLNTTVEWARAFPHGAKGEYPVNLPILNDFNFEITPPNGRNNGSNLKVGAYSVKVRALGSSLNFQGITTFSNIQVVKANFTDLFLPVLSMSTMETNADLYKRIQENIIRTAQNNGLELETRDFTILGLNPGDQNHLIPGHRAIHINGGGRGDNLISGATTIDVTVTKANLESYLGNQINLRAYTMNDHGNDIIAQAQEQLRKGLSGLNLDQRIINKFNFILYEPNGRVANPNEKMVGGVYTLTIIADNSGDNPFYGSIQKEINVPHKSLDKIRTAIVVNANEINLIASPPTTVKTLQDKYQTKIINYFNQNNWNLSRISYNIEVKLNNNWLQPTTQLQAGNYYIHISFTGNYLENGFVEFNITLQNPTQ